jgi:hypothetical protein
MSLQDELHGALFRIFVQIDILKFQKIQNKFLDVDNDLFYHAAKSQRKKVCIPAYTKMSNSGKSEDF